MDSVSLWESRWKSCGGGGNRELHVPLTGAACVLGDCPVGVLAKNDLVPVPRHLLTQGNSSLVNISVPIGCCFPVFTAALKMPAGYTLLGQWRNKGNMACSLPKVIKPCRREEFYPK